MKKLTIDTSKLTDHQTSLLMDLFCDVLGGQEMADITNVPHAFTLTVEEVSTPKEKKISEIKRILDKCFNGTTSTSEIEADSSPCISSKGNGRMNVSVLVEDFSMSEVRVVTYNDDTPISEGELTYEELDEDIIDEILDLLEQEEVEHDKTWERCQ